MNQYVMNINNSVDEITACGFGNPVPFSDRYFRIDEDVYIDEKLSPNNAGSQIMKMQNLGDIF